MSGPVALAVLAVAALVAAYGYGLWEFGAPGAGLMPCLGATLLLIASVFVFREKQSAAGDDVHVGRIAGYGGGLLLLPLAVSVVGMLPALGLFILILLRLAEGVRWRAAVAAAVISSAAAWLLFGHLLQVPLPGGMVW